MMGLYNYVGIYKLKILNRIKVKVLVISVIYHKKTNKIIIGITQDNFFFIIIFQFIYNLVQPSN